MDIKYVTFAGECEIKVENYNYYPHSPYTKLIVKNRRRLCTIADLFGDCTHSPAIVHNRRFTTFAVTYILNESKQLNQKLRNMHIKTSIKPTEEGNSYSIKINSTTYQIVVNNIKFINHCVA